MLRQLLSRLLQIVPVMLIVTFAVFSMTFLLPGDPTHAILGERSTEQQRAALREQLGLDRPIPTQYVRWLGKVVTGDFGRSLLTQEPVKDMLAQRVPVTLQLTLLSMLLAVLIGVPCGIVAAVRRNSWVDSMVSFFAMSSMAVPYFWAGILLIMLFSIHLHWLPTSGYVPLTQDPLQSLKYSVLPTLTVGGAMAGLIMRQTRASMLGVMTADYIRTARAKGSSELRVIVFHGLRNAMIPVITVTGLQLGTLIGGAVVTETVFSLPGLGRMMVDGIFGRDFPAVQGAILVVVVGILLLNVLMDLSYRMVDKRIGR
jgi:peptide/nickel transport system permease protein